MHHVQGDRRSAVGYLPRQIARQGGKLLRGELPTLRPIGDNGEGLPVGGTEPVCQGDAQASTQRGGTGKGFLAELGSGISAAQRQLELRGTGQRVAPVDG